MKVNYWNLYPVIPAIVLASAAVLLLFNGFLLIDSAPIKPAVLEKIHLKLAAATLLWILGSGMASRARFGTWTRGLLCGLALLPGLILLVLTTRPKNRQEMWEHLNPAPKGTPPMRRQTLNTRALY